MGQSWTHEIFLDKFKKANPVIYDQVEFLEEYTAYDSPIRFKTKYGIANMWIKTLLSTRRFQAILAENPTEFWINQAKETHNNKYTYPRAIFKKASKPIVVTCKKHGDFTLLATSHLAGYGCRKCGEEASGLKHRDTHEEFIQKVSEINPHILEQVTFLDEYVSTHIPLKAQHKYGDVLLKPTETMRGGRYKNINVEQAIDKTAFIKNVFIAKFGNKYDYSLVEYKNSYTSIKIICPIHGEMTTTARKHIHSPTGCGKCGRYAGNWTKTQFATRSIGRDPVCYIIKCFNEEETFLKIGISNNIEKRFYKSNIPYEIEYVTLYRGSGGFVWELEKEFHRQHRKEKLKYTPQKTFGGYTECFVKLLPEEKLTKIVQMVREKEKN